MSGSHGYGLFEVFTRKWDDGTPISALTRDKAIVQSIQDHMTRLLNARQGVLSHLPDYGLPDILAVYGDLPYAIKDLKKSIIECVTKYEPRIVGMEVISLPDDREKGVVILEIRATLIGGRAVRFETYLKSEGYATVTQSIGQE